MKTVGAKATKETASTAAEAVQEAAAEATDWSGVTLQAMRRALRMKGLRDTGHMSREACIRALEEQGGMPDESEKGI